jgi:hypothetical protein
MAKRGAIDSGPVSAWDGSESRQAEGKYAKGGAKVQERMNLEL